MKTNFNPSTRLRELAGVGQLQSLVDDICVSKVLENSPLHIFQQWIDQLESMIHSEDPVHRRSSAVLIGLTIEQNTHFREKSRIWISWILSRCQQAVHAKKTDAPLFLSVAARAINWSFRFGEERVGGGHVPGNWEDLIQKVFNLQLQLLASGQAVREGFDNLQMLLVIHPGLMRSNSAQIEALCIKTLISENSVSLKYLASCIVIVANFGDFSIMNRVCCTIHYLLDLMLPKAQSMKILVSSTYYGTHKEPETKSLQLYQLSRFIEALTFVLRNETLCRQLPDILMLSIMHRLHFLFDSGSFSANFLTLSNESSVSLFRESTELLAVFGSRICAKISRMWSARVLDLMDANPDYTLKCLMYRSFSSLLTSDQSILNSTATKCLDILERDLSYLQNLAHRHRNKPALNSDLSTLLENIVEVATKLVRFRVDGPEQLLKRGIINQFIGLLHCDSLGIAGTTRVLEFLTESCSFGAGNSIRLQARLHLVSRLLHSRSRLIRNSSGRTLLSLNLLIHSSIPALPFEGGHIPSRSANPTVYSNVNRFDASVHTGKRTLDNIDFEATTRITATAKQSTTTPVMSEMESTGIGSEQLMPLRIGSAPSIPPLVGLNLFQESGVHFPIQSAKSDHMNDTEEMNQDDYSDVSNHKRLSDEDMASDEGYEHPDIVLDDNEYNDE